MKKAAPEFVFAKNMPLTVRLAWIAVLSLIGITVQLLFSLFIGWIAVFIAILMGSMRTVSNEPALTGSGEWQNTTIEEFEQAEVLIAKTRQFRSDTGLFNAGSGAGCMAVFFLLVGIGGICLLLATTADAGINLDAILSPVFAGGSLAALFGIDALTLMLPLWIFGRAKSWEPPNLQKRMSQLAYIVKIIKQSPQLDLVPSLFVQKAGDGTVPVDCKLMAALKDADKSFMGIQIQTTLNSVQGTLYPYTYCVLIAKPEFELLRKAQRVVLMPPPGGFDVGWLADANAKKERVFPRYKSSIAELKQEKDVEIAVVRQQTSGQGYTTTTDQAAAVFANAFSLAREIVAIR